MIKSLCRMAVVMKNFLNNPGADIVVLDEIPVRIYGLISRKEVL